jgi:tetratricopeptide (TPR) repeat protein
MKTVLIFAMLLLSAPLFSQDVAVTLKEATNFERALKDAEALNKYKEVLAVEPTNIVALVRSSELTTGLGVKQTDKKLKKEFYDKARDFAEQALKVNAESADANYVRALVALRLTEVDTENKKLVADLKDAKTFSEKAIAINPDHGKANYVLGKWNADMVRFPWAKKAAVKVLFGGMPDGTIEDAYKYMERSRTLEPYFVQNFLDLAKAYKSDYKPAKAIEVLNQLVKLPLRTSNDAAMKAEGRQILAEMQ